jgi:hypothetical protein
MRAEGLAIAVGDMGFMGTWAEVGGQRECQSSFYRLPSTIH